MGNFHFYAGIWCRQHSITGLPQRGIECQLGESPAVQRKCWGPRFRGTYNQRA
jgi:hypothetical protein